MKAKRKLQQTERMRRVNGGLPPIGPNFGRRGNRDRPLLGENVSPMYDPPPGGAVESVRRSRA